MNRTTLRTKIAIPETIRQDKGNYKLVAENCYGKAQHVIRVEILGEENVPCRVCFYGFTVWWWSRVSLEIKVKYENLYILKITLTKPCIFRPPSSSKEHRGLRHQGGLVLPDLGCPRGQRRQRDHQLHCGTQRRQQEEVGLRSSDHQPHRQEIRGESWPHSRKTKLLWSLMLIKNQIAHLHV